MPTGSGATLADLADLLGEATFAWDAGAGLALHAGARLGLAGAPEVAGHALLAALDGADRRRLEEALARPGPVDLEVRREPWGPEGGPHRWLRVRAGAGPSPRRVGTVADVTEAHQLERALRILSDATSTATGQGYLNALVRALAEAVGATWTFVATLMPERPGVARTVACWHDGRFHEPFEYALSGSPCDHVMSRSMVQIVAGAARDYPGDAWLVDQRVEAYLGVALCGADGRPLGLLVAVDDRPRAPIKDVEALLGLFAARAAAELERLRAERELRAGEARFRGIVETCVEGVAVLDGKARCLYANPQLAALLGAPSAEALVGTSYRDFTGPDQSAMVERRHGVRRPGDSDRYEVTLRRLDGREIQVEVSASTLGGEDGRPAGFVALFRDVTEQKALDEQVREAQKRESLGLLAGGVAHDFNNLLVGILANAGFALSELPHGSEARAAVEDIRGAAQRASELTRQLLAYSGRGKLAAGPVDLNKVARDMGALAAPALSRKARIDWRLAEGELVVEGDAGQLGQTVMNLLTNASDALAGEPGTIAVRSQVAVLDRAALARFQGGEGLPEGRYALLEVSDDGAGMDEVTRGRVFEPFFTTKFTGRGLGLPAALGIVRGHRGAIRVESAPEKGTRVAVALPLPEGLAAAATPPARPPAAAAEAGGRPVILVADDEAVVRRAARRALEKAGFEVVEAVDGPAAVAAFRAGPGRFACLLLDVTMPGLTGEQVLAEVRPARPGLPVILTSGFLERDDPPGEGGPLFYLPKPFGPSDLLDTVKAAVAAAGP
jgi:PAS domain S-box-containing protein